MTHYIYTSTYLYKKNTSLTILLPPVVLSLFYLSSKYLSRYIQSAMASIQSSDTNLQAEALNIVEQIYRDYQKRADAGSNGRYISTLSLDSAMQDRINELQVRAGSVSENSLIFVAILAVSSTYMEQLHTCPSRLWSKLVDVLVENKSSIEFYARSRGVVWLQAVRKLIGSLYTENNRPPAALRLLSDQALATVPPPNGISDQLLHQNLDGNGPDTFYLTQEGTIVPMQAQTNNPLQLPARMVDIKDSIYIPQYFQKSPPPSGWPWPSWPQHPQQCKELAFGTFRRTLCKSCGQTFSPQNEWEKLDVGCQCRNWCVDALVQIVQYPAYPGAPNVVNRGARALQVFEANTIIGEYVGIFIPCNSDAASKYVDDTYNFTLNDISDDKEMALLSARLYGNWTRFINHSNDPDVRNIRYDQVQVMNRSRIVIRTTRKIEFGEEIVGDYGPNYGLS